MLTEAAFLADICENADDDAPRLIFADWLDDHNESVRAEFIRVQVERSRLPLEDPRQSKLSRRETELRTLHEADWLAAELPVLEGVTWEDFKRGFVDAVFVDSVAVFLKHAPVLFTVAPIQRLQIGQIADVSARELAQSPELAHLTELNLGNNPRLGRSGVRALANSPHIDDLRALLLHYNNLGNQPIIELAASPHLEQLEELYISGNDLSDAAVIALAHTKNMPRLADLDLRDNRIANEGITALAFSDQRAALETLFLVNNQIGPAGTAALAETPWLPGLVRLYLNYNPIGNDGAQAIADTLQLRALLDLDLRHCDIRDTGARALANGWAHLDRLQTLWLSGNALRLETITLLRRRFGERLRF